jgi:hypothetical protein
VLLKLKKHINEVCQLVLERLYLFNDLFPEQIAMAVVLHCRKACGLLDIANIQLLFG